MYQLEIIHPMINDEIFNKNEMLGYFASIVIILSFLVFDDIRKIRTGNMVGALLFVIYGVMIEKFPIVFLNSCMVVIQVYYIWIKKSNKRDDK